MSNLETRIIVSAKDMATAQFRAVDGAVNQLTSRVGGLGTALTGLAAGVGVKSLLDQFGAWDAGLIGVRKTTGLAGAEFERFREGIRAMGQDVAVPTEKLLEIAQAAGQLGVSGTDNLLRYTKTVAQLATASDLAGEKGATELARLQTVTGETAETVDVLGSVIVALGNNMPATESEIVDMATQVGQATSAFRVSSAEAAAMGAAMKALGVRAELGGSSVGRSMRAIEAAVTGGGQQLERMAALMGVTGEEVRRVFARDATGAFVLFIEGLGRAMAQGRSAASVLEQFSLSGEEVLKVLPTLAMRSEVLGQALGIARRETASATALTNEAAEAQRGYTAQMVLAENAMRDAAVTVGGALAPAVVSAAQEFRAWVEVNREFLEQDLAGNVGEIAAQAGEVGRVFGGLLANTAQGFAALPDVVQEMGIVGALAFGRTGLLVLTALSLGAKGIEDIVESTRMAMSGDMTWGEWWTMGMESLGGQDYEELKARVGTIEGLTQKLETLRYRMRTSIYESDKQAYREQMAEVEAQLAVAQHLEDNTRRAEAYGRAMDEAYARAGARAHSAQGAAEPDAAGRPLASSAASSATDAQRAQALKQLGERYAQLTMTAKEFERYRVEEQFKEWGLALGSTNPLLQQTLELQRAVLDATATTPEQDRLLEIAEGRRVAFDMLKNVDADAVRLAQAQGGAAQQERDLALVADFSEKYRALKLGDTALALAQIEEQARAYVQAGADEVAVAQWVAQEKLAASDEWQDGALRALAEYAREARNAAANVETAITSGVSSMEDALVEFVTTGKFAFSDLVDSMVEDLARLTVRQSITGPLSAGLSSWMGSLFTASAKGNVFPAGPGISAYSSTVVDRPTLFPFARGIGLMGEAGAEAILPLTRTRGGELGVRAEGGGAQNLNVRVEVINESGQPMRAVRQQQSVDAQGTVVRLWLAGLADNTSGLADRLANMRG